MKNKPILVFALSFLLVGGGIFLWLISTIGLTSSSVAMRSHDPLYINDIKVLDDGSFLTIEKGVRQLTHYDADFSLVRKCWQFESIPTGVCASSKHIYVTTFEREGELHFIDRLSGSEVKRVQVGSGATFPMIDAERGLVYVLNQFSNNVVAVDMQSGEVKHRIDVLREPMEAVFDRSGRYLFVVNHLPVGRADVDTVAACVSVIDLNRFRKVKDIQLYNGSNALRSACLSPDGRYLFVTHNLGRFQVPTNQLQQGWMNTSGVSVINVEKMVLEGTVLLDEPERGAAGIWGVAYADGKLLVTHSGTHDISIIDYDAFISKFEAYSRKEALAYDLRFLYDLRRRVELYGNGPRNFVVKAGVAYIPTYFSDTLNRLDIASERVSYVPLVANRIETEEQKGEKYFNDATYCFQNWQSCNGCHPSEGRMDAMNWDLMNDGIGNPKNCKSLLYSHTTPPSMISGIRVSAELAVRKGFHHIQFSEIPDAKAECVDKYLRSLRHVQSPYLINGELSDKAKRGKKVFEKFKCNNCHSGPFFTDLQLYRIGDDIEFEKGWDTPTLVETWRTAPYLFDGRAATMEEVFQKYRHGIDGKISKKEVEELAEYVNSL